MKILFSAIFIFFISGVIAQQSGTPITIQVDLSKKTNEPLKPIWNWFGYDEPNYTYMKDGKKLLSLPDRDRGTGPEMIFEPTP